MKQVFKNTWAILERKEKNRFSLLIILDIIISILDILSLIVLLWIIQFYIQPDKAIRLSFLPNWLSDKDSVLFIALFFILFAIKNIAAFFVTRAEYIFLGDVAVRLSANSLSAYQHSPFREFIDIDSSVYIQRISIQPFDFCQYVLGGIQQIITQSSLTIIAITAILLFNAKLFLLLLIILLPPVFFLFYFIKKKLDKSKRHIKTNNENSIRYLLDALKGYIESNIYEKKQFFMNRFAEARKKFSTHLFESLSIQNIPSRVIEIFAVLGLFILIAIAKWAGDNNAGTLLTIGAFMAAAYKIIPGIVKLVNVSGQMRAYAFLTNDLLTQDQKIPQTKKEMLPFAIDSVEFKTVSFKYDKQEILENISFRLQKGDLLGIKGRSGKGKTTILNLLLGFLEPVTGDICINEKPVNATALRNYWSSVAYVRQQPFFIHDTILRNITLEEEQPDPGRLDYAITSSGLKEIFPEGLEKIITENGKNISGGQQQRITIARALYKDSPLLLLDEPFNELDEGSVILILAHLKQLAAKGKMIVLITHDSKSLSYCNKVIPVDETAQ